MARSRKYQDFLIEQLKDHDQAVAYLNAALEESLKGDEESQQTLLFHDRLFNDTYMEKASIVLKISSS